MRVKSFVPGLLWGRLGVGSADTLVRRPIPANLLVSRCASVPIPLDSPHSGSTIKIKNHILQAKKEREGKSQKTKED